MSTNFDRLKFVDERFKCLVYGFTNELNKDSNMSIKEIANLCILYYYEMERFIRCSKDIEIIDGDQAGTQNIVNVVNAVTSWRSAYGEMIIDSIKYPNAVYQWTFKINMNSVSIGIVSVQDDIENDNSVEGYLGWHNKFYALGNDGDLESSSQGYPQDTIYKERSTVGDIITMIYNAKNKTLSFIKNETPVKIACKDVDIATKYRLAISTWCRGQDETIELTDFKISFV